MMGSILSKSFLLLSLLILSTPAWATDSLAPKTDSTSSFEFGVACIARAMTNFDHPDVALPTKPARYNEGPWNFLLSKKDMPWTSSYFPMNKNGIAVRWQNSADPMPADFADPEKLLETTDRQTIINRLKSLTPQQINALSAVEKLDILKGNYDFLATRTELKVRGSQRNPPPKWWEGFCNGVCAASINLPEPITPVTMKNPDKIAVTFQPNDVKALANASYFFVEKYAQVGSPNHTQANISIETLPNPGALDYALTHYLGKLHKAFVADKEPGPEIWNHVVVGYERRLEPMRSAGKQAPPGVKYTVMANVQIKYSGGGVTHETANRPTAPIMADGSGNLIASKPYRYQLFLDANKKIIGGKWPANTKDAPDFLWFPAGKGTDSTEGLNPYISFDDVLDLVKRSAQ